MYSGWTNYETWAVNLWMTNDQGSQDHWIQRAENLTARELMNELKNTHEEYIPDSISGLYSDLLVGALDNVNWREIAEHWVEGSKDEDEDE